MTARDGYSFLHLPMVAGVVLLALGIKKTLGHVDEPLELVPAMVVVDGLGNGGAWCWKPSPKGERVG